MLAICRGLHSRDQALDVPLNARKGQGKGVDENAELSRESEKRECLGDAKSLESGEYLTVAIAVNEARL